ncbi:tubulin domain-containing protein [Dipodascopsis uninucleata]
MIQNPIHLTFKTSGGFGYLPKYSGSYSESAFTTSGPIERIERNQIEKSEYVRSLDSDANDPIVLSTSTARYWSDYCNVYYHPRSLQQLGNWEYHPEKAPDGIARGSQNLDTDVTPSTDGSAASSSIRNFRGYDIGVAEYQDPANENGREALDRDFRAILEECDNLGGLNLLTDIDSAWGGFSSELLRDIRDDYISTKLPVISWGLETNSRISHADMYSRIRSLGSLITSSTLYVPVRIPGPGSNKYEPFFGSAEAAARFNPTSLWHSSALLSTVLETVTLPTRTWIRNESLDSMVNRLGAGSAGYRSVVGDVDIAVGEGERLRIGYDTNYQDQDITQRTGSGSRRAWKQSTKDSSLTQDPHVFNRWSVARRGGASNEELKKKMSRFIPPEKLNPYDPTRGYVQECTLPVIYPVPDSFPDIVVGGNTNALIYSSLATTVSVRREFIQIKDFVSKYVRGDEREELKNGFADLINEYEDGWSSGSDSE